MHIKLHGLSPWPLGLALNIQDIFAGKGKAAGGAEYVRGDYLTSFAAASENAQADMASDADSARRGAGLAPLRREEVECQGA